MPRKVLQKTDSLPYHVTARANNREEFHLPLHQFWGIIGDECLNMTLVYGVEFHALVLMPNHFHMQVKQYTKEGIEKLARRILTGYVQYFNKKYKRIGTLFESTYKAILLETDEQFLYLSSYIHRNPMRLKKPKFDYIQFSSYPYYLNLKNADWIKPKEILSYFRSSRNITTDDKLSYQNFVESFKEDPLSVIKPFALENEEEY